VAKAASARTILRSLLLEPGRAPLKSERPDNDGHELAQSKILYLLYD